MAAKDMKQVTLALQGGGAHGAFTWGVLEGLLDDGRIRIEGISGFMGNPVLEPLVRQCHTSDTLVVQINPTHREQIPVTAHSIADRKNEITFNASLMREIRSYADVTRLIDKGNRAGPQGTAGLFPPHCSRGRNGPFGAPEQAGHQLELFDAVAGYRERKDPELAAGELPAPG